MKLFAKLFHKEAPAHVILAKNNCVLKVRELKHALELTLVMYEREITVHLGISDVLMLRGNIFDYLCNTVEYGDNLLSVKDGYVCICNSLQGASVVVGPKWSEKPSLWFSGLTAGDLRKFANYLQDYWYRY